MLGSGQRERVAYSVSVFEAWMWKGLHHKEEIGTKKSVEKNVLPISWSIFKQVLCFFLSFCFLLPSLCLHLSLFFLSLFLYLSSRFSHSDLIQLRRLECIKEYQRVQVKFQKHIKDGCLSASAIIHVPQTPLAGQTWFMVNVKNIKER